MALSKKITGPLHAYKKPLFTDNGFSKCIRPLSGKSTSRNISHGVICRIRINKTGK